MCEFDFKPIARIVQIAVSEGVGVVGDSFEASGGIVAVGCGSHGGLPSIGA
ncbi:MAG: hypothetical protein R6U56_00575 [Opitutales bacterium]